MILWFNITRLPHNPPHIIFQLRTIYLQGLERDLRRQKNSFEAHNFRALEI